MTLKIKAEKNEKRITHSVNYLFSQCGNNDGLTAFWN